MACNPLQIEREKFKKVKHLVKDKQAAKHGNKPDDAPMKEEDLCDPKNQAVKLPRRPEKNLPVP